MKCSSGKRVYASEQLAEEALIEAHAQSDYGAGRGPQSVYLCGDCGQYHLTSRGPMNARLEKMQKDGSLARLRIANQWQRKFTGRK